jgi:hypothetical protein
MDSVNSGIIGGALIAFLVIIPGVITVSRTDFGEKFLSVNMTFTWLIFLSGLMVGQMYLTYVLVSAFAAAPKQTDQAVVK